MDYLKNPYLMSAAFSLVSVGGLYIDSKQRQSEYTIKDYGKMFLLTVTVLLIFYYFVSNGASFGQIAGVTALPSLGTVVEKLTEDGFPIQQTIQTGVPNF